MMNRAFPCVLNAVRSCGFLAALLVVVARADDAPGSLALSQPELRRGSERIQSALVRFRAAEFELLVIDNGSSRAKPAFRNLSDAMERSRCQAGTNGGFFDLGSFQPNGLMISQGKVTGQYDGKNWAEGVLAVRAGVPSLIERGQFKLDPSISDVLQTGPWLVRHGAAQTGFRNDADPRPRTFIATDGQGTWLIGHLSGCTLRELGTLLCSHPIKSIMTVQDALNLDGGSSSAFWFKPGSGDPTYIQENTIVRNFVGVRRREGTFR